MASSDGLGRLRNSRAGRLVTDSATPFSVAYLKASLQPGMSEGWRLTWRQWGDRAPGRRRLSLQRRAYLPRWLHAGAGAASRREGAGSSALGAKPVPGEAVRTVQTALAEAFQLLTETKSKQHDDDYRDDFGAYWLAP